MEEVVVVVVVVVVVFVYVCVCVGGGGGINQEVCQTVPQRRNNAELSFHNTVKNKINMSFCLVAEDTLSTTYTFM